MADPPEGKEEVAAFLRGDPVSLAEIESAARLVVRSFRFGNPDLESDLVQDTLSRILQSLSAGRFRAESSLRTYARNVARYACLEHIRRRRWEVEIDPEGLSAPDRGSAPEASYLWTEEHLRNLQIFSALPAECRELLRLVCIEGASYREAAIRLGISEAALKSRVHRCRIACREAAGRGARAARRAPGRERP